MIACAAVLLFFAIVSSGPDPAERVAEIMPAAQVAYLPSAGCRAVAPRVTWGEYLVAHEEYLDGKRRYEDLPVFGGPR